MGNAIGFPNTYWVESAIQRLNNRGQLYKYLTDSKLQSSHQPGFRSAHSTVTALLEATDSWSLNTDHSNINAVVFLDFKKAVAMVDPTLLLSKLDCCGITGPKGE